MWPSTRTPATSGYGFSGTHAHLPTDRLIVDCIVHSFGPLLIGEDPREVLALWEKLHKQSEIYWVGRAGITHLALGAIDIALWDLKAKAAGQPLWKLLGGSASKKVEAYNTDGGWLNWSLETMVSDCKRLVEEEGYRAVKLKVGGPNPREDLRRVEAVRNALGPDIRIMTDANGRWSLPQAIQTAGRLVDFDIAWIEEPIYFDDVEGHRRLAETIATPIALGRATLHRVAVPGFHPCRRGALRPAGCRPARGRHRVLAGGGHGPLLQPAGRAACRGHVPGPSARLLRASGVRVAGIHPVAARLDGGTRENRSRPLHRPRGPGAGMTPSRKALDTINRI